jgi:xanthine/CO dehydrogenase XdhC/CoxF family maturation factor
LRVAVDTLYYQSRRREDKRVQRFLESACPRIVTGRGVVVMVVSTDGSTPRKAGARMLVSSDGSTVGTIGGGWLEQEALRVAGELLASGRGELLRRYTLRGRDGNAPMVCGGEIELLFQLLRITW